MKKFFLLCGLCVLALLAAPPLRAQDLTWVTDLAQAQTQARSEHKSVLLVFHGSNWCPPCIEMQRQVFQSPEFIDYARKTLVLVDVDFPEKGSQSDDLKRANAALKVKFNVGDNYPTLSLLNDAGETVYQESGYSGGGPAEILRALQRHAGPISATAEPAGFKSIGVPEFAKLAADPGNVILDVRTPEEFQAGHLSGAVNLNISAPDFPERIKALDRTKTYLVHCASGGRSARACGKLAQLDFPRLYNLSGGIHAWIKAGQPVVK